MEISRIYICNRNIYSGPLADFEIEDELETRYVYFSQLATWEAAFENCLSELLSLSRKLVIVYGVGLGIGALLAMPLAKYHHYFIAENMKGEFEAKIERESI